MSKLLMHLSLLLLESFLFQTLILANDDNGFSMKLIYRDSPESLLHQPNLSREGRMEQLLQISDARVRSLINISSRNTSYRSFYEPLAIRPPISEQYASSLYYVQVGIGKFDSVPPYKTYNLVLDTGSDTIWTQCEGCSPCFPQQTPPFPKSQSQSFQALPCRRCAQGRPCGQDCMESLRYGDGTRVKGVRAKETFTFQSNIRGAFEKIKKINFLCAMYTQGFKSGTVRNNVISGILGLDRGQASLSRQLGRQSKFSYCLQPLDGASGRIPMFLRFNADVPNMRTGYSTPFVDGNDPYSYNLDLLELSVGQTRLNLGPQVFRDSGGCMIDSGSPITYIVDHAYEVLENALVRHIREQDPGLARAHLPADRFLLCYVLTNPELSIRLFPKITFHFANDADFVIHPPEYLNTYYYESRGYTCLEIKPTPRLTILGATQQVNHRIVYDIGESRLKFVRQDCSASN